ncbi:MAG: hypothetical protein IJD45_03650 [Clostridia bacterium]|nr:hypothetical protein [Clostridia bacterium]
MICVPSHFIFENECITINYLFFQNERYLWKNIYKITATIDSTSSKHYILDSIFSRVYKIEGNVEGEKKVYMNGLIVRNRRTRMLLEKYWDGNISGTSKKKKKCAKAYDTAEISALERQVKTNVSTLMERYSANAKLYNLKLKKNFIYITEEFEELSSRPKENYTYSLIVEISHFGETNTDRVVLVSIDLLYARLGKNSYKGVINKNLENDLVDYVENVLNEIYKNGIDVYCKNN